MKNKLIAGLVLSISIMSLVGCSSGEGNVTTNESTVTQEQTTTEEKKEESIPGKLGNYNVEVTGSEVFKNYEDKDCIKVDFKFTNNSEEATSADMALMTTAFQDGIEISQTFDFEKLGENDSKQIKPGATIDVSVGFELSNLDSPVEFEITEFLGLNNDKVIEVINLK